MQNVYYVTCPNCDFVYYVDNILVEGSYPTVCPKCHSEFKLQDSKTPLEVNPKA